MSETFAKRLKEERERKGWTQQEMASMLGISNGTLSGYERNYREPDLDTLYEISKLTGVSVDYYLGRTDLRQYPQVPLSAFADILPPDLAEFIRKHDGHQWAVLSRQIQEHDLTPEEVSNIIDMVMRLKEYTETAESKDDPKKKESE